MLSASYEWRGPSADSDDVQLGDVVERTTLAEAGSYDAVLVGEPYDGGHVIGRPGARNGPGALREALAGTKTHHYDNGPVTSVGDLGDVTIDPGLSVAEAQEAFRDAATRVHDAAALPVFMGGDHSLVYANVRPLLDRHDSVGVVNLDSHADVRSSIDGQPHIGTPFRQLYEAGLDAYVQVGARQLGLSTPYVEYLEDRGGEVVTAEAVGRDVDAAAETALEAVSGVDALYVSFDVDVLDATAAPGTSAPEPGGILSREAFRLLRLFAADERVVGLGVYELAPMLDREGVTTTAAARGVVHFLSVR